MEAKISVLGLILSSYQYLRSAMVRFPLLNTKLLLLFDNKKYPNTKNNELYLVHGFEYQILTKFQQLCK